MSETRKSVYPITSSRIYANPRFPTYTKHGINKASDTNKQQEGTSLMVMAILPDLGTCCMYTHTRCVHAEYTQISTRFTLGRSMPLAYLQA